MDTNNIKELFNNWLANYDFDKHYERCADSYNLRNYVVNQIDFDEEREDFYNYLLANEIEEDDECMEEWFECAYHGLDAEWECRFDLEMAEAIIANVPEDFEMEWDSTLASAFRMFIEGLVGKVKMLKSCDYYQFEEEIIEGLVEMYQEEHADDSSSFTYWAKNNHWQIGETILENLVYAE